MSGEQTKYTLEKIEAIANKLRAMPPVEKKKQEHSKIETVKMLRSEIAAMQKRGYSLDQVSEALRGEGLDILTPTLKNYLQRVKAKAKGTSSKSTAAKSTVTKTTGSKKAAPKPAGVKTPETSLNKATFTARPDSSDI